MNCCASRISHFFWLGKSKYEFYKKGEYSIDKFADPLNKRGYTLTELKTLDEKTFELLGV